MTAEQWFVLGRDFALMAIAVLVFFWGLDRKNVEQRIEARFQAMLRDTTQSFALRDQRIDILQERQEHHAEKSSEMSGRVTAKIGNLEMRLVSLETLLDRRGKPRHD